MRRHQVEETAPYFTHIASTEAWKDNGVIQATEQARAYTKHLSKYAYFGVDARRTFSIMLFVEYVRFLQTAAVAWPGFGVPQSSVPLPFGVGNAYPKVANAGVFCILAQTIPCWKMPRVGDAREAPGLCREVPSLLSVPLFQLLSVTLNH